MDFWQHCNFSQLLNLHGRRQQKEDRFFWQSKHIRRTWSVVVGQRRNGRETSEGSREKLGKGTGTRPSRENIAPKSWKRRPRLAILPSDPSRYLATPPVSLSCHLSPSWVPPRPLSEFPWTKSWRHDRSMWTNRWTDERSNGRADERTIGRTDERTNETSSKKSNALIFFQLLSAFCLKNLQT